MGWKPKHGRETQQGNNSCSDVTDTKQHCWTIKKKKSLLNVPITLSFCFVFLSAWLCTPQPVTQRSSQWCHYSSVKGGAPSQRGSAHRQNINNTVYGVDGLRSVPTEKGKWKHGWAQASHGSTFLLHISWMWLSAAHWKYANASFYFIGATNSAYLYMQIKCAIMRFLRLRGTYKLNTHNPSVTCV